MRGEVPGCLPAILSLLATMIAVTAVFSPPAAAQGGPPFITTDPGTPGDGNWEINVMSYSERHPAARIFDAPLLDLNYGVGSRIQLTYEVPYLVVGTDGGPTRSGLGKSLPGVKWRFYDNDENHLQISVFPQLEFNNPDRSLQRGLVAYGTRFYLPVEIEKKVGPFEVNPEVGYYFSNRAGSEWEAGVVVGNEVSKRLELDGELYSTANTNGLNHWNSYDAGARYKLSEHFIVLIMAGSSFNRPSSSQPQFFGYGGMQFLFSMKHKKESPAESEP
jgi:opacity protein-like surface antigen